MQTCTTAHAFALVLALAASATRANEPTAVLAAKDFTSIEGLEQAVNDPALAERPVVEIDPKGQFRVRVQFRSYLLTDADGTRIEISAPAGWPAVYAAVSLGKTAPIALTVPVAAGKTVTVHHAVSGPPPQKSQVAYTRVVIEDEAGGAVNATTLEKLAEARDGIAGLIATTRYWNESAPSIAKGVMTFHLRALPAAKDGSFQWRLAWPKGSTPLDVALTLHAGKAADVMMELVHKDRPKDPVFRVRAPLQSYPDTAFSPAGKVRVVLGKETLHESASLAKLPDPPDLFWHTDFADPPSVIDGVLTFGLKPYDFRDIRGEPVTIEAPAEGWIAFCRQVRAGEKVSVRTTVKGFDPLKDVLLPPPGKVVVSEPALARTAVDAPAKVLAMVPTTPSRTMQLLVRRDHLYWPKQSAMGRGAADAWLFCPSSASADSPRWFLAGLDATVGSAPLVQHKLLADDWLKLPTALGAADTLKVRIEHTVPTDWGYAGSGWSVDLEAKAGVLDLTRSEIPVDLRFVTRLLVTAGKRDYELKVPFSPGKAADVMSGRIQSGFVGWWSRLRLTEPNPDSTVILVMDGSLADRFRAAERVAEWSQWETAAASVRKKAGKKLAIAVARNGVAELIGTDGAGDPEGPSTFAEASFPPSLVNLAAQCSGAKRIVILASGYGFPPKPVNSWAAPASPEIKVIRAAGTATAEDIESLLRKAIEP